MNVYREIYLSQRYIRIKACSERCTGAHCESKVKQVCLWQGGQTKAPEKHSKSSKAGSLELGELEGSVANENACTPE